MGLEATVRAGRVGCDEPCGVQSPVRARGQRRRGPVQRPHSPCRPQGVRDRIFCYYCCNNYACEQAQRQEGALLPGLLPEAEREPRVSQQQLRHQPGGAQPAVPQPRPPEARSAPPLPLFSGGHPPHCGCLAEPHLVQNTSKVRH